MVSLRAPLFIGLLAGCGHADTADRDLEPAPELTPPGEVTVTAEDIERAPGKPIEEVLATRFPGVHVTRAPDGGIVV
ncbi:MAG: hypothetical protein ACYTA3_07520, partial [Planctomycetota bacterium]